MDGTIAVKFDELQAHIKRMIRYETDIRRAVKEQREERRKRRDDGGGRAPLHISKPTEMMAIENLTPLECVYVRCGAKKARARIENPEGWLQAISFVRGSLPSFEKRFMAVAFYQSDWIVCSDFHLSTQKFYALKKEIIMKVAIKAAADGLISFLSED